RETYACRGESIDIGCGDFPVAVHADVGVAKIIGNDQQDIRPPGLTMRALASGRNDAQKHRRGGERSERASHARALQREVVRSIHWRLLLFQSPTVLTLAPGHANRR